MKKPHSAVRQRLTFSQGGFSLVEMAIVLLIVGFLIGGMLMPLSAQQEIRQRQETEATLAEIRDALIGYAIANQRLPRPASTYSDGTEMADDCLTDADCKGFIPWATLGVKRSDGWGKLIRYRVTSSFANTYIDPITKTEKTQIDPESKVQFGTLTVQTVQGPNHIFLAGSDTCSAKDKNCVPAVIYSQGKLRDGTTEDGVVLPVSAPPDKNVDEQTNAESGTKFVSRTPSDNSAATGGEFDDIVVWISASTLYARLSAAGQLR